MGIRQELESRLAAFAAAQIPPLAVAYENVGFVKPINKPWLECFIIPAGTINPTADGERIRKRGTFQVNVWCPKSNGLKQVEEIAEKVVAAFPLLPKTGTVSIEQTPNTSRAIIDDSGFVIIPVSATWRYEGTVSTT